MFTHPSHRHLKNRSLKRRVSAHRYNPAKDSEQAETNDYDQQRANQSALNKLKRQPELIEQISQNLAEKQRQTPKQPQLIQWQTLLDSIKQNDMTIDELAEQVMECGKAATLLRKHSALDCLYD
jgi:hypothetical protein